MSISDQVLRIVSTCRRGCHNALNSRQIFKGRSSRILKDSFNQKCEACVEGGGRERKGRRGGRGGGRRRVHQSCDWNCWRVWKIRWVLFNMHRAFGNFWLSCWLFFLWERRVVEFWCLASRSWINRWLTLVVGLQCARRRCLLVRMAAWMLLPLLRCRDARQESLDVTRWRRAIISILIGTECLSTTISTLRKFPLSFSFSLSLSLLRPFPFQHPIDHEFPIDRCCRLAKLWTSPMAVNSSTPFAPNETTSTAPFHPMEICQRNLSAIFAEVKTRQSLTTGLTSALFHSIPRHK